MTDRWSAQLAIVGAGAAGDAAAFSARKHGFEGSVVLIGSDPHRPYERPYLSKQYLRGEIPEDRVFLRPAEEYEKQRIELLSGRTVVEARRLDKELLLDDGRRIDFETLILATGGRPRTLPGVPGAANVFTLRTLDDSRAIRQAVRDSGRLLFLGAGFIGAEAAASARLLGKDVLMVEAAPVPLGRALGTEVGQLYARMHRERGVDLRTGTTVTSWRTSADRVRAVELSDGSVLEVDAVLIGVGIDAEVGLASQLGLDLGSGGVLADGTLQAAPGIFVAGDIAAHHHPVFRRPVRAEHWQVAQRQGTAAGAAVAGSPQPYEELPWFWSDQYDVGLQYVGSAQEFDQTVWRGDVEGYRFSVFYLKEGVIEAVLSINDGRTGRLSRELIRRRVRVEADALADQDTDLRELAAVAIG